MSSMSHTKTTTGSLGCPAGKWLSNRWRSVVFGGWVWRFVPARNPSSWAMRKFKVELGDKKSSRPASREKRQQKVFSTPT